MKNQFRLSQIIEGYLLYAQARHLSSHTVEDYSNTFRKFQAYFGDIDPPFQSITHQNVEAFLAAQTLRNKTLLNYHVGLSALWTYALKENLAEEHTLHLVDRPKPEEVEITPLSKQELAALLQAVNSSAAYTRPGKRTCSNALPEALRNRAIILLLLDTGIRAEELCTMKIKDTDLKYRRIVVFGKGSKERMVPFSPATGQALWRYLATRKDAKAAETVFVTRYDKPLDGNQLGKRLGMIGKRAGVSGVTPHRFRHTFAINYLRNGGDPWTLQAILGHSTMAMVHRYLQLAQADVEARHQLASPVSNWGLR